MRSRKKYRETIETAKIAKFGSHFILVKIETSIMFPNFSLCLFFIIERGISLLSLLTLPSTTCPLFS